MATKVVTDEEYKGNKMFKVYKLDDDGKQTQYPLVSIGKKKLKTILDNIEAAREFVGDEDE